MCKAISKSLLNSSQIPNYDEIDLLFKILMTEI